MKIHGDRKRHSGSQHLDKYSSKHSSSSKSRYSQGYKDRRADVSERAMTHRADDEASPSQHLWVGNVSTSVTKTMLAEQFSRFGDVEVVKLFSMKNYAFVSLKTVEDAVYAKKGLHGSVLGGLAIRIEFAKGVNHPADEKVTSEMEKQTEEKIALQDRGQKDELAASPEKKPAHMKASNSEERNRQSPEMPKGNRNCDSSEVLWIGFPLHLKIDEKKLHKLFAPFGGVEKITTFPGRTYAFVRFQNVKAAARAKDALQGKLFNDPRVSISFAKSEVGPVDHYQGNSELCPSSPLKLQSGTWTVSRSKDEEASLVSSSLSAKVEAEISNHPLAPQRKDEVLPSTDPQTFSNLTSSRKEHEIGTDSHWSPSSFFMPSSGRGINENAYSSPNPGGQPKASFDVKGDFTEIAGFNHGAKLEIDKGMPVFQKDSFLESEDIKQEERWMLQEDYSNKREQKRGRVEIEHPSSGGLTMLGSSHDKPRVQVEDGEAKRQRLGDHHFWGQVSNSAGGDTDLSDQKTFFPSHETWDDRQSQNKGLLGRTHSPRNDREMALPPGSEENWDSKEGSRRSLLGGLPLPDSNLEQPSVAYRNEHGLVESPISPPPPDIESPVCLPTKDVFRWEGVIAKGGMEVCRCRCFPATKEINVMFPHILNCTARTSLDMLAKYISQVMEFSVVLFMPQGVPDVAPYQELMAFLADKQRAAVCKLSEENTLFLVPPSDFVEQFLNVPKSNNILGVVLSQHQQLNQPPSTLTEQQVSSLKPTLLVDDLKKSLQRLEGYAITETISTVISAQSLAEMKTAQPTTSQSILYPPSQFEGSNMDPSLSTFQNFSTKSVGGHDKSQDHDVVTDNGRMLYQTQGSKSLPVDYQLHENNLLFLRDKSSMPFQIPGNNSVPHAPHMFGGPGLPVAIKLPHQDPGMQSHPRMFFAPHIANTPEPHSVRGSSQMSAENQRVFGSFPFQEQPRSAPVVPPQPAPSSQLNAPLAHLQQSFTFGSTHLQQQFPLFDGGQKDVQVQSSNFTFKSGASNSRNMLSSYPPILEPGMRPPGLPSGPPPPESGLRPPGPPPGLLPASLSQGQAKLGVEKEPQQALEMALAGLQGQECSDEEQKKFRATVELAAALLQQLQQQTKM